MTQLSSRDKKLLVLVFALLIIYGLFRFGYQPFIDTVNSNKETLESYQIQQNEMISALSRYGVQDETIDQLSDNINERLDKVSNYQSNQDIEDYLILLSDGLNITFNDIYFTEYGLVEMNAILDESYMGDEEEIGYQLKDYACNINDCSVDSYLEETVPLVTLEKKEVTMSFETSQESYLSYLDKINDDNKTMLIVQSSNSVNESGNDNFSIVLDIYSIKGW